jgi:hypothetical protein
MSSLDFDLDDANRSDTARERLDRIEELKSRILARMERHADNAPVQDWSMEGDNYAAQISAMKDRLGDAELSAELLERRWFAAMAAAKSLQDDCDTLLRVVERAENNWLRTCAQLALVESLRDALGERLAARDGVRATSLEANTQPPIYVGQQPQRSDHQEL